MGDEWIEVKDEHKVYGFDERFVLRFYRFNKQQWKFWLGFVIGIVVIVFVIK